MLSWRCNADSAEDSGGHPLFSPNGTMFDETPDRIRLLSATAVPAASDGGADHPQLESGGAIHLVIASVLMRRLGQLYAASTAIALIGTVVFLSVDAAKQYRTRPDFTAFYSAAVLVICTVAMSASQIHRHLSNWFMPDVQKYVVRILLMVPVYSIQSWCSLRFHAVRIYFDAVRDLYEAFVIQSFVYYLIELLGGEDSLVEKLRAKGPIEHQAGFHLVFKRWEMGRPFMFHCKYGVLQYVVAKTLCTTATVILEEFDCYGEGSFSFTKGYIYINTVINLSQIWALYSLVLLYHATAEELRSPKNWRPLGKFLCIKGVVFFTYWQSVGIFFLKANGLISDAGDWDTNDVANGVQDYLICLEMLCFAVAHGVTFTEKECMPPSSGGDGQGEVGVDGNSNEVLSNRVRGGINLLHDIDEEDGDYQPPTIRTLHAPMRIRDALWSSTVPTETIDDIRRLRHGVSNEIMNGNDQEGLIGQVCMDHSESI